MSDKQQKPEAPKEVTDELPDDLLDHVAGGGNSGAQGADPIEADLREGGVTAGVK